MRRKRNLSRNKEHPAGKRLEREESKGGTIAIGHQPWKEFLAGRKGGAHVLRKREGGFFRMAPRKIGGNQRRNTLSHHPNRGANSTKGRWKRKGRKKGEEREVDCYF